MIRGRISQVGLVLTGTAMAALLAGCGETANSSGQAPDPSTSQSTVSPTPSTTPPPTSSESSEPAPPGNPGEKLCKVADLSLSLGRGDGAAGTVYRPLIFKNVSGSQCILHGFPGVSYVAGNDGHQVGPAAFRDGNKGAAVTLNSGESASADVGFVNVQNYDPTVCSPQPVRGIRVYPPQDVNSAFVEMSNATGCGSDKIPGNQLTVKTITKG